MNKRILSLLLAVLLPASATACGNGSAKTDETTNASDTNGGNAETASTETALTDALPDGLDFGGATYTIYAREDLEWGTEMYVDELTGEIVNDAIYNRSRNVDERLNVAITQVTAPGIWGNETSFNEAIRSAVMAGDSSYQLVAGYAYYITALATDGLFMNLLDVPHIDFEKPWWNSDLRDELTLYDQLYFACGDLSLTLLSSGDAEMIGAVTEALAFDSYENVTPAYFESAMKAKYSQDEASARMLDIIRDGLTFNFGFVNSSSCENMIHILRDVAKSNKGYATIYAENEAKYTAALDTLVAKYKELGEKLSAAK